MTDKKNDKGAAAADKKTVDKRRNLTKKLHVAKAKKVARINKKGKSAKNYRIHTDVRFHRPNTLVHSKNPKFPRLARKAISKKAPKDFFSVIRAPLSTEKAMKKMEDENTMVFLADPRANKKQIKEAFEAIYSVKVRRVNTLIRPDGKKKAYIRLSPDSDSLNLSNKIGII
jgi:large subunit ribosomal protein L23Ae